MRKNGGKRAVLTTAKNKEEIKDIVLNQSPTAFGYLKNTWSIRLLSTYLSSLLGMNISCSQTWRIVHDLGILYNHHKINLNKSEDYDQKKEKIDRYKKISHALLKKDTAGV